MTPMDLLKKMFTPILKPNVQFRSRDYVDSSITQTKNNHQTCNYYDRHRGKKLL